MIIYRYGHINESVETHNYIMCISRLKLLKSNPVFTSSVCIALSGTGPLMVTSYLFFDFIESAILIKQLLKWYEPLPCMANQALTNSCCLELTVLFLAV